MKKMKNKTGGKMGNGWVRLTVRVPRDVLEAFDREARGLFLSRNEAVVAALRAFIPRMREEREMLRRAEEEWRRAIVSPKARSEG